MERYQFFRKYAICLDIKEGCPILLIVDSKGIITQKLIIKPGDLMKNATNGMSITKLQSIINEVDIINTTKNLGIKTPNCYTCKIESCTYNMELRVWPIK